MNKVIVFVVLLLMVLPAAAQDDAPALPDGCNVGTLSEILSNIGAGLGEEAISADEAIFLADALSETLEATRNACAEEIEQSAIDYTEIQQSRTEDGAFVLGDPDAPITIVEFADFLCPHCQNYHATIHELIETHVATGEAKLEYRFFPVVDPNLSPLVASMTECAGILQPDNFWHAHDVMYDLTSAGVNGLLPFTFAAKSGLNYEDLLTCIEEDAEQVAIDTEVGQTAEVGGTPTIMVRYDEGDLEYITNSDGEVIPASSIPLETLSEVIAAAQE